MHGMIRWVAVVMVIVSAGAFAHAAGDPEEDMPTGTTPTTNPASAGRSPTTFDRTVSPRVGLSPLPSRRHDAGSCGVEEANRAVTGARGKRFT